MCRCWSLCHLGSLLIITFGTVSTVVDAMDVQPWPLPEMDASAGQPDLRGDGSGRLLLGWIERRADHAYSLQYSRFDTQDRAGDVGSSPGLWQPVRTIASGKDWFVNWADTPHLLALPNGTLWAHWLRRNGGGIYNYGIALTRSNDDGVTWSPPIRIEPDGASNDHGFVSLWPQGRDELGIAWLDSRQKPPPGEHPAHDHDSHSGAAMMLRAALFDAKGERHKETALDLSTCDCCPTSVASTQRGPVVVYRGRTPDEVRDTRLVRFDGTRWTAPVTVHVDGWTFAGCPVNGPAVVANGNTVWVVWYTESEGQPSLRLARSGDAGDHFESPVRLAEGRDVLGRAALALDGNNLWVAWLAETDDKQALWLARVDAKTGTQIEKQRVADVSARGRASGLPKLEAVGGTAWVVWTDVIAGKPTLRGVSVR